MMTEELGRPDCKKKPTLVGLKGNVPNLGKKEPSREQGGKSHNSKKESQTIIMDLERKRLQKIKVCKGVPEIRLLR